MRQLTPQQVASAAGATLIAAPATPAPGPEQATIDSRLAGPGALFVGLPGASVDGGGFAGQALAAGAWGTLTAPEHAERAAAAQIAPGGVVLAAADPLHALQQLANRWRRELRAPVIGVTGSTGKTSTKDLLLAVLAPHRRTVASRANFNTEIGLPLEILAAPAGTEVLVLEMAMRGPGQIAELAAIAEPDVAVIVNIGPVHLELLGSIEAIAAAKAELIEALPAGGTAVIPADEPLLDPHRRSDVTTVTFGPGGEVSTITADHRSVTIDARGRAIRLEVDFTQPHLRTDLLAAVAAAQAIGVTASGRVAPGRSAGRGRRHLVGDGVTVIDDCYNANPTSMRAALDDLAAAGPDAATAAAGPDAAAADDGADDGAGPAARGRRIAVLGDMLELGPGAREFHAEVGDRAAQAGVDVLVTVGPLAASIAERFDGETHAVADAGEAAALVPGLLAPGDVVLVKASRGVGLELVCRALGAGDPA